MPTRRQLLPLPLLALAGCAAPVPRTPADDAQARGLLVVSALHQALSVSLVDKAAFAGTQSREDLPPMTGLNDEVYRRLSTAISATRPSLRVHRFAVDRSSPAFEAQSTISGFMTARNEAQVQAQAKALGCDLVLVVDDAGHTAEYSSRSSGAAVSVSSSIDQSEVRIFAAARMILCSGEGQHITARYSNQTRFYPLSTFSIDLSTRVESVRRAHPLLSRAVGAHMLAAVDDMAVRLGYGPPVAGIAAT